LNRNKKGSYFQILLNLSYGLGGDILGIYLIGGGFQFFFDVIDRDNIHNVD
jgi:hypothetical protein